ncbi:hypothetical protein Lfu02_45370 [Longispora fulva]|uniref:Uncharacterized protein n=1 Tax=Longispora fulva TaxID=619741 RepID=A0A8J7KXJ2_9ACTN|nr:DUF5701 family protein [Longispora fulva]MBG6137912.1 hypothetical protein [Longispora fulva]GIG60165.1 hypothetical protein Lfu02_45370 [Longispora fulva]
MTTFDAGAEFDRQVQGLLDLGYPALAGLTAGEFATLVAPARETVLARGPMGPATASAVPFALVVRVDPYRSVPLLTLAGKKKPGVVDRNYAEGEVARFVPVEDLGVPDVAAYVVFDVERGEEFCDVRPQEAMETIAGRGRTPLTIEEGIAVATHFPATLEKNKCFMLGGSRCGDRRVPALWISAGAPKLGWCWAGNPHTWLGTASAGARA